MSKVEKLQASVVKAEEKVKKCKGTIERHQKQLAKKVEVLVANGVDLNDVKAHYRTHMHSEVHDYEWKLDDIKGATRNLRDAEIVLANWKEKLDKELEKERFLNENVPQVVKDFLEQWKKMMYKWYVEAYPRYVEEKEEFRRHEENGEAEYKKANPQGRTWGTEFDSFMKKYFKDNNIRATYLMYPPIVRTMDTYHNEAERLAWLDKELEEDKRAKMIDLINRVNEIVGVITDASGLRISAKGNLDGIIVGTVSKAKVETIGAGGLPDGVQCFHFRTLVHELK